MKAGRDKSIFPIFAAVTVSFLLAIVVSIYSLTMLARENTKEIDMMLTYRIYDTISSSLNEPITVAKTMACDDFLADFLEHEDDMDESEAVAVMQRYLSGLRDGLGYDSAFLVSERSRRYYTYEGLNKIVDPENDEHDVWYSLFIDKDKPYDLDVDSDEVNQGLWTVFVNVRIVDESGTLLGVCGVGMQMTNLQELFLTSEREYGVKINLVDRNGLVQVDTEDINIENAWLDEEVLSREETDEYVYQTTGNNEFAVTKYVEYLGWYLVVRSAPTSISKDFINIILLNVALFLVVMAILIFTVAVILRRSKRERDDREKLLIVSERAVAASEAKSSFLSSMSHEIRTPINAVLGMNEMILREAEDENILEYASNIQNAGKTLLALINSILDFSKIEEGKMELVPVRYDVSSMVNDLVNSISERAKNKGLEFVLAVDHTLPCALFGDDVRIRQVIMNLLTNAVKYTESGKVTLSINGKRTEENTLLLCVSVKDTGIGIRKEDMGKLFESFARLDVTRNRGIEGTGLGMSIVTRLLDMMGTSLKVESEYGKGSEFSFELVQEIVDHEPIGDLAERLKRSAGRATEKRYLFAPEARILLVDDNEMNRKVARNLMKRNGIVPDEAASGAEAIRIMAEKRYDIVLLDHMMPNMDGIETLQRLKGKGLIPEGCVVIALTANAISGARERYIDAGFDDYLSKPIEISQLEKKLAAHLPKSKVAWKETADERAASAPENAREISPESGAAPLGEVFEFEAYSDEEDDILEFIPDESNGGSRNKTDESFDGLAEKLGQIGLDVQSALSFCGDDFEFYLELLSDFAKNCSDKKKELDAHFEGGQWHAFKVEVHALKSTSKTIGAEGLSQKALALEKAAGSMDDEFIRATYPSFAKEYEGLSESISEIVIR